MLESNAQFEAWLKSMASSIAQNIEPDVDYAAHFLNNPEQALQLIHLIDAIEESENEAEFSYYSACVLALDIFLEQLQSAGENGHKLAKKVVGQMIVQLTQVIGSMNHTLGFWMPIINAFYSAHLELPNELKQAYMTRASVEDEFVDISHLEPRDAVSEMIQELSDLSAFDIAENFFAQSHAMPAEFFADLVCDLFSLDEGAEIGILMFLHPQQEVRHIVLATFSQVVNQLTLSSNSLSRLQAIKHWYPNDRALFESWIRNQRKQGVVFRPEPKNAVFNIKASEVDGTGAQGILIHIKTPKSHRLCGLLFKQEIGIKDAWITPVMSAKEAVQYYQESLRGAVTLREVDVDYLMKMTNHFMALSMSKGNMPDLHLLDIQEALNVQFIPEFLDIEHLIKQLSIEISPFASESILASFKRSKSWPKNKQFTESWYLESAEIDKLVNRHSSIVDGSKVCKIRGAEADVLAHHMEAHRDQWLFHFFWMALWLKAKPTKREKMWEDSFFIAYAIQSGIELSAIPIMHEICHQTVLNSIETMNVRRTHLNLD